MAKRKKEQASERLTLELRARAASRTQTFDSQVRNWLAQGFDEEAILGALDAEIDAGRGPFAEMANGAVDDAYMESTRIIAVETAQELAGGDDEAMGTWMSTGGDNVCPGCEALHGAEMTLDEFMQKHGTNECGSRCYCYWVPDKVERGEGPAKMRDEK